MSSDAATLAGPPSQDDPLAPGRKFCEFESFEFDADEGAYRVFYDSGDVAPSTAIISALAVLTDTDPLDIEPLHSTVDPDALDALATRHPPTDEDLEIAFPLHAHEVTVKSYGRLEIRSALSEDAAAGCGNADE